MTSIDLFNTQRRQALFRFELLDSSNNWIGDLAVDAHSTPSINHDTTRSINRTISSILLDRKITNDVDPFSDRVRPLMEFPGGRSYPLGTFLFGSSSRLKSSMGTLRTSALVDQTFIVDLPIERSVSFVSGTLLTTAISMVLAEAGDFECSIEPSQAVVGATPLAWRAGTSALSVVNDICAILGYHPFHFNNEGIGVVKAAIDATAGTPTISYDRGTRIYDDTLVEADNLLEVPNRYIVVDTSSILGPIVGIYDVPATLPHSYERRGFYLREVIEIQGLESVAQANLAAATFAQRDARQGRASFTGPPDPRHDSYDLLWVDGKKYLEIGWTLPLVEGGDMQHSLVLVSV